MVLQNTSVHIDLVGVLSLDLADLVRQLDVLVEQIIILLLVVADVLLVLQPLLFLQVLLVLEAPLALLHLLTQPPNLILVRADHLLYLFQLAVCLKQLVRLPLGLLFGSSQFPTLFGIVL